MAAKRRVIVIGAGVGGLVTALLCAARGHETLVIEAAAAPGGKLREVEAEGRRIDTGPTVFTMRDVFEDIFEDAGLSLADHIKLTRAHKLARHAWPDGSRLDLTGDVDADAAAIGDFAGPRESRGYREFAARSARVYHTLRDTFIRASRPNLLSLSSRIGLARTPDLLAISPFTTLWRALGDHFADPRLKQLFARYATYCGSSPFECPATLMLVAHVEREGVWFVEGGMQRIADALRRAAEQAGARFLFDTRVTKLKVAGGRAAGVETETGESFEAEAVVFNGDVAALGAGLLGEAAIRAAPASTPPEPSLSAVTWAGTAETDGFPLLRHNVFFGADYAEEFEAVFRHRRLPAQPTVYLCANARTDEGMGSNQREPLFCLVNAPAERGKSLSASELRSCENSARELMARCGLRLRWENPQRTTPADFAQRFPMTGGALYGPASHGWRASFRRPGTRARLPGLYFAGGSVHPGPGVPMAALSGRQAALTLMSDLASINLSARAAISGGTSTLSATTGFLD